MPLIGTV
jgi:hypothetical protein